MASFGIIADIGGTNARFALVDHNHVISQIIKLPVQDFENFEDAVAEYIRQINIKEKPKHLLIDVAGPVTGDYFKFTNSHWEFSITDVKAKMGFDYFKVVNDFAAIGLSLPHLTAADFISINNKPAKKLGPKIAIGPGTGLGVVFSVPHHDEWILVPSEAGHVTMAAENEIESDVLAYLRQKYESYNGHVSAERVISGHGLENIYDALWHLSIDDSSHEFKPLRAPEIAQKALDGEDALCTQAVLQLCAFLGATAGSLSLALMAYGGVYIAGGIVPQIMPLFEQSDFIKRFESKGRHSHVNKDVPIYLITHPYPAFPGLAATIADELNKEI
ncbi:MAG: glucokinase [Alphaproteobacteria bacterium]